MEEVVFYFDTTRMSGPSSACSFSVFERCSSSCNAFPPTAGFSIPTVVSRWLSITSFFQILTYTGYLSSTSASLLDTLLPGRTYTKAKIYPIIGIAIAVCASLALTTAPIMGGKTMPPEIAATSNDPPILVCLPNPLSPSVNMVAKQQDSKHKTSINIAIDVAPAVFIAAVTKTKHSPR